jgi:microcystin degradation protein MlrC
MRKFRVAIGQLWQEQNTFSPVKTDIEDFKQYGLYFGNEIIKRFSEVNELGGFISTANTKKDVELVPIMRAWTWPKGNVRAEVYDKLKEDFIDFLIKAKPLDGILISFHGAMVADNVFDIEGDILETIHREVLDKIPVAISCDLHANITKKMLDNAIFIEGYHTCPHIDLFRTGKKTAEILFKILRDNNFKLNIGFNKLPMITPARLHDSQKSPFKDIFAFIKSIEDKSDVTGVSFFPVQPWLDVPELGWSILVYANSTKEKAQYYADQVADYAWNLRKDFFAGEISPKEAMLEASKMKEGLMVISDSDATTAGAPGDNTCILKEMLAQNIKYRALMSFIDKDVVYKAIDAGVGKIITTEIGGKMDDIFSKPVQITATVKNITDGRFEIDGHVGKNYFDIGKTAILTIGNISILVCEKNGPFYEQTVYKNAGLDPRDFRVVVVKSPVGFRYAYEEIADKIILVKHPGLSSSDLDLFDFKNIPRPLYPLDEISDLEI